MPMMLDLLWSLIVAVCALAVYANTLGNEFVFDDQLIVSASLRYLPGMPSHRKRSWWIEIRSVFTNPRCDRPLLMASYRRDAEQAELDSAGLPVPTDWHATNLALHAINAVLVYGIARAFLNSFPAGMAALVFAAHPLTQPAVATISGRSSVLCGTFYFGATVSALCGWWPLMVLSGWLAWKTKEEALMLPFTIAALLVLR